MTSESEQQIYLPQPPTRRKLGEKGIATALSIDHWSAPASSRCCCEAAPELSVNFICMHPGQDEGEDASPPPEPPDKPAAARFQEIFVDLVGMHCASLDAASRHVLDDRFSSFLGKGEREFKEALMTLMHDGITEDARKTPAYRALDEILRSKMGFRNSYLWSNRNKTNYYHREDSDDNWKPVVKRGTRMLSQLFMSGAEKDDTADPRTMVHSILDDILTNRETSRRLRFSGSEASEDRLRSILRDSVSEENLDVLFTSLKDPSFQNESKVFQTLLRPPGHVFVCNASVCDLTCDAFLCPGNIARRKDWISGTILSRWLESTVNKNEKLKEHICPFEFKRYESHERVVTHRNWPWEEIRCGKIVPVPFFVGGEVSLEKSRQGKSNRKSKRLPLPSSEQHVKSLMETARQFIDVSLQELRSHQPEPLAGRERYLLAMPVIGTGGGFAGDLTGNVVESLLHLMSDHVFCQGDVDIVLVCADEATYAHAQSIRLNLLQKNDQAAERDNFGPATMFPCFQWLTDDMRDHAEQLAELASSGHLAFFLGAGVSIGSGLPGWFGLLHLIEDLFTPNGTVGERKLGNATKWNPLQMANLLEGICSSRPDRNGTHASLKKRICDHIDEFGQRPGLLLSLLVSLPCQSVVTQNYDRLIEKAFENWNVRDALSSKELSVIPYCPRRNVHHWLLKMHGCTQASEEIVISGTDYDQYDSSRYKALGGLLQASLMTKHLLFVGFSLTDPNYLNIVQQVRSALHDDSNKKEAPVCGARNCTV